MANVLEQLLNALALAGLLFLVSAGLSLVFGILRILIRRDDDTHRTHSSPV